jgi:hypothetical protein
MAACPFSRGFPDDSQPLRQNKKNGQRSSRPQKAEALGTKIPMRRGRSVRKKTELSPANYLGSNVEPLCPGLAEHDVVPEWTEAGKSGCGANLFDVEEAAQRLFRITKRVTTDLDS